MTVTINRVRIRGLTMDGSLYIDGMRICDTAENAKGALPAGTYTIRIAKSRQHARKMPKIIADGSSPLIIPGNGVYNLTDGSIIVGKHLVPGIVTHSKAAFDNLYERIRKNIERGQKVLLIIND